MYAKSFNTADQDESFMESFFHGKFKVSIDLKYIDSMERLILEKESYCLGLIKKYAPKFDIESMNIENTLPMMIGIVEMFFLEEEIPVKVSINESVELAKVYADDSSKRIVNGVLNKIYQDIEIIEKNIEDYKLDINFSYF
jgi:N utilization substance protein B